MIKGARVILRMSRERGYTTSRGTVVDTLTHSVGKLAAVRWDDYPMVRTGWFFVSGLEVVS